MKHLWVKKYRPKTINEYVFQNDQQRHKVEEWIKSKDIPHLMFRGDPGTGKSTFAEVLLHDLGVQEQDILRINGSRQTSVDDIRETVTSFSETYPWGSFKVVFIDEADYLSVNAQAALRGVIEQYESSVRFILTCNYPNRIMEAIHSRCQGFRISNHDRNEFTAKIAEILLDNKIEFDLDVLDTFVRAQYPDLRKAINVVEESCVDGKLQEPGDSTIDTAWRLTMVELFKENKIREARELIVGNTSVDEIEEIYTFLYRNLDLFCKDDDMKDNAIIVIRNGLVKHSQVADPEINLSATMVELSQIL